MPRELVERRQNDDELSNEIAVIWMIAGVVLLFASQGFVVTLAFRSPFGKMVAAVGGTVGSVYGFRVGRFLGLITGTTLGYYFGGLLGNGIDDLYNLLGHQIG